MPFHRAALTLMCSCFLVTVVGCGSSSPKSHRPTTTSTTAPTTSRPTPTADGAERDRAEIKSAFEGWADLERQFETEHTKWSDELAKRYIAGPFLDFSRSWITKWQAAGRLAQRPANPIQSSYFTITETNERSAGARSCIVNDYATVSSSGVVLDDSVATHFATWEFRLTSSGWRIWDVPEQHVERGRSSCDD